MKKLICFAILLLVFSISAFAADIGTADELLTLMNTPSMWNGDYTLTADIDLSTATNGLAQTPIGTKDNPYDGTFDGAGYEISGIDISGEQYVALFGYIKGATITDLTISGTVSASSYYCGGLVAYASGEMYISKCHNKCNVLGAMEYVGGICGYAYGSDKSTTTPKMNITECMNSGTITCLDKTQSDAGGIAGSIYAVGNVSDCLNTGLVTTGDVELDKPYIGGIVGKTGSYGRVTNCYNTVAPVTPSEATTYVRAIVGRPNVKNGANNFFKDGLGMSDKNYGSIYSVDKFELLNANGLWVNAEEPCLAYFYVAPEEPDDPEEPDVPDEPDVPEVTLDSEIENADQLLTLMNYTHLWNADYVLVADIDLADATVELGQAPIGSAETPYSGTFDGNGYEISGIDISGEQYVALFGYVNEATIKNLTVDGTVTASSYYCGGIVAYAGSGAVTVENCHNKCTVTGMEYIAGIVGYMKGTDSVNSEEPKSVINNCLNSGTINASDPKQSDAGGIVGSAWNIGWIKNCLNTGLVTTGDVAPEKAYLGGICGKTYSFVRIENCYNAVAPETASESTNYVRGIVGYPGAKNSFNNYYKDGLGMSDAACGNPYTTADFSMLNVYGAWINKNEPMLKSFYICEHDEVAYRTVVASTCAEKGSVAEICEICFEEVGTAELPYDENEHTAYTWMLVDGKYLYVCDGCGEAFEALENNVTVAPTFAVAGNGKILLTVTVTAAEPVFTVGFDVEAPEGAVLVNAASASVAFTFMGATDYENPYRMAFISSAGVADIFSASVTLTYDIPDAAFGDEFAFAVNALEAYGDSGATCVTTADALVTYDEAVVGDIDGDGAVTLADVMSILKAFTNDRFIENADLNGDGQINLIDVIRALKAVVE